MKAIEAVSGFWPVHSGRLPGRFPSAGVGDRRVRDLDLHLSWSRLVPSDIGEDRVEIFRIVPGEAQRGGHGDARYGDILNARRM